MLFNLNNGFICRIFKPFRDLFTLSLRQGGRPALAFSSKGKNLLGKSLNLLPEKPNTQVFNTIVATCLIAHPGYFEPWGNDAGLKPAAPKTAPEKVSIATKIADAVIHFHQEVISPVDGPRSHFRPSSSQYMQQAIHNYGFLKGFIMGCDRLLRENDEEWVYRTVQWEGKFYKYDPAKTNKYE